MEVLRGRDRGLSLPAAIAQATAAAAGTPVFAGLRRRHPGLAIHVLPEPILPALTWAIEDECCAKAQRPVLAGCVQNRRFCAAASPRWASMARTAEQTRVFAGFPQARQRPGPVAEVPIPEASPVQREWALICDAADLPACVVGWEYPGQDRKPGTHRTFEALWPVDPAVVRSAALVAAGLAEAAPPGQFAALEQRLAEPAAPAPPISVQPVACPSAPPTTWPGSGRAVSLNDRSAA